MKVCSSSYPNTVGWLAWQTAMYMEHKLARRLNGVRLFDRKPTKYLLENLKMKSVNQINCQIKWIEIWKSQNFADHPLKLKKTDSLHDTIITRACTNGRLIEDTKSNINNKTFKMMPFGFGIRPQLK